MNREVEHGYKVLTLLLEKLTIDEIKLLCETPIDSLYCEINRRAALAAIKHDGL